MTPHIEIEAKMRLADRAAVERTLDALGAELLARLHEVNTFFDTPDGELRQADRGLRTRVETDGAGRRTVTITHKGPRAAGPIKQRQEAEISTDDARRAEQLLLALGYQPGLSFEKRRDRYLLDGCRIELDTLPRLGSFIEIEGPDEQRVLAVRRKLGLADEPMITPSYASMLREHILEHGLTQTHIGFEAPAEPSGA